MLIQGILLTFVEISPKNMKTPGRTLLSGSLVIFAVFLSGSISSAGRPSRTAPQYEGVIFTPGLYDSVTVYRDERGMPHIYATSEHDLYMAVGFVSAQERLWQMDLIRRSTTGRLSEILGKSFLQSDIFSRCLQVKEKSKLVVENEDPEIIACMQAYADGVNSFINSAGKRLPLEFRLLSYTPEPWSLEDIVNITGLLGWNLDSRNLLAEISNYQIVRKLGAQKASGLIPDWNNNTDPVYPDFVIDDTLISLTKSLVSSFNRITELGVTAFSGSNNWAVSGNRTETGKPLLSNDMHLSFTNPSIWMQMHQIVPGKLDVTGVLIPGEPFIVAGHNQKIAWGMTNLMVDNVDLYTEKLNPENRNQYLFNGEWKEIMNKSEIIKIKGGKQDTVVIGFTHRGPVISGLLNPENLSTKIKWSANNYFSGLKDLDDISLSMRWVGYDISDEVRSIYLIDRAAGWNDFRDGLKNFRAISQNFIYADIYGNIGLSTGGGIPIRKGNGIQIRNGDNDEFDWKGYVPFEQLPFSYNPVNGQVSSANNKTVNDDYPYFISQDFVAPYRINRIRQMLGEKEIFNAEDFKRMINDQHSDLARLLTPYILRLNSRPDELTASEAAALAALSDWDYDMNPRLTAPAIFEFFRISFRRNLLADELGDLYDGLYYMTSEYYIYELLTNGPDEWVDNINTVEKETLDDIVMQSFKDCIRSLTKQYGKNPEKWEWGKIHTITFMHPVGSVKILGCLYKLNSKRFGIGGSDHTVSPYFTFKPEFKVVYGASERHIFNTADWDESYSVIPGGSSGVPGSEFYLSQVKAYLSGQFYKDLFSENAVKTSAKHVLVLVPF